MTFRVPLLTTEAGIRHEWQDNEDGTYTVISSADCEPVIEQNKAMANHNDGYSPSRELRRVASIPLIVAYQWLVDEGWNAFDPANADRLKRKLNDPDWRWLRTADGRL